MKLVVPWAELVSLVSPHTPARGAKGGRPPFAVETMLRIHFVQQWFNLSDLTMEEALYDMVRLREFVGLDAGEDYLPDEGTILRFRHLLEQHNLSLQILATVNATLAAKGLLLKKRHGGRCYADCHTQFDQEQHRRCGTPRCIKPRRVTNGISA